MAFKFPLTELFSVEGQRKTVQSPDAFDAAVKEGWFEPDAATLEAAYQRKLDAMRPKSAPAPTMGKLPDGGEDQELIGSKDWIDAPSPEAAPGDTFSRRSVNKKRGK